VSNIQRPIFIPEPEIVHAVPLSTVHTSYLAFQVQQLQEGSNLMVRCNTPLYKNIERSYSDALNYCLYHTEATKCVQIVGTSLFSVGVAKKRAAIYGDAFMSCEIAARLRMRVSVRSLTI